MPRYSVYTLLGARADYRQFFTLEDAQAYADTLTKPIIFDRLHGWRRNAHVD